MLGGVRSRHTVDVVVALICDYVANSPARVRNISGVSGNDVDM